MRRGFGRPGRLAACLLGLAGATGCFKGLERLEPFPCVTETLSCPAGFHCSEGLCLSGDGPGDAGPSADAGSASDAAAPPDAGFFQDAALSPEWALWRVPPDSPSDYTVSDAGVVTDNVTGLVWQRAASDLTYTADGANGYCRDLVLGDVRGWTLPTQIELLSIVDFDQVGPSIDPTAFPDTPSECFWSSSQVGWTVDKSWYVTFVGSSLYGDNGKPCRARCVIRPATRPGGHYAPPAEGTVLDERTGLTWQQKAPTRTYSQTEALDYCRVLPLGTWSSGWHLPTARQLLTLVKYNDKAYSALDPAVFTGEPTTEYWSSTPFADTPSTGAWFVGFQSGGGNSSYDSFSRTWVHVRCVHE